MSLSMMENSRKRSHIRSGIALEAKNARAFVGKGVALNELSNYTEALIAFDAAIAITPGYAKAWFEKGTALYKLGRYDEAITAYDKALEISRVCVSHLLWESERLSGMGTIRCDPLMKKALNSNPACDAWTMKGNALAATRDFQGDCRIRQGSLAGSGYQPALKGKASVSGNYHRYSYRNAGHAETTKTLTTTSAPQALPRNHCDQEDSPPYLPCTCRNTFATYIAVKRMT